MRQRRRLKPAGERGSDNGDDPGCHDVLIGMKIAGAEGRWRGRCPGSKVSMITMREPQWGQGWSNSSEWVPS